MDQVYGYRIMNIPLWFGYVWGILTLSLPSPSPGSRHWYPWLLRFVSSLTWISAVSLCNFEPLRPLSQADSDPWDLSSLYQQRLNKNLMSSLNWSLVRHFTGRLQDFLFLSALSRVNDDFLAQTPRSPCWIFHPFEKERMRSPVALIQVGLPSDTSQIHEVSVLIDSKGRHIHIIYGILQMYDMALW